MKRIKLLCKKLGFGQREFNEVLDQLKRGETIETVIRRLKAWKADMDHEAHCENMESLYIESTYY